MGGRLDEKLFLSTEYHMPYVGEVYRRSIMTVGRFGVALPVPKKRASLAVVSWHLRMWEHALG